MITKKDAIAIGQAIVKGMEKECYNVNQDKDIVYSIRGTAILAIDNLWHDAFLSKTRAQFNYSLEEYYNAIGWKE